MSFIMKVSNCPLVRVAQKSDKYRKPYIGNRLDSRLACHSFAMFALRSRASHRVIELFRITQLADSAFRYALHGVQLSASLAGYVRPTVSDLASYALPSWLTDNVSTAADNVLSRPLPHL